MHRGLEILEVVEMICAQVASETKDLYPLSKDAAHTLAVLARTSTTFLNPALDVLWRNQETLVNLLRCMPNDVWEINERVGNRGLDIRLWRPIVSTDWERPLFYLHRVKSFHTAGFTQNIGFLDVLDISLPQEYIFPNLQKLDWYPHLHTAIRDTAIRQARFFLAPRLTNLQLAPIVNISQLSILANLAIKCPSLTHVSIFTQGFELGGLEIPAVSRFVGGLTRIISIDVPGLDESALDHLAQLPDVMSLRFRGRLKSSQSSRLPSSAHGGFPVLKTLSFIFAALDSVGAILARSSNSPLKRLGISADCDQPTKNTARSFYATLAGHCSIAEQINMYSVGGDILHPLFSFTNLVSVKLWHPVGFDLDDATILAMASAWPQIENLSLTSSLSRHMPSRITHEGIYAFAQHCPSLRLLHITFDATLVPKGWNTGETRISQERLICIDVASSPVDRPRRVAKFMAAIFPNLRRICTLYEVVVGGDDGEDVFVDPEVQAVHDLWKDVEEDLPAFEDE
ncbi:hypothetical protein C8R43DRAFT_1139661 [Mycena crocata]|nr:hypothetical protein C8R43DRAFT_1139661 [Mycena crocata]